MLEKFHLPQKDGDQALSLMIGVADFARSQNRTLANRIHRWAGDMYSASLVNVGFRSDNEYALLFMNLDKNFSRAATPQ